MNEKNKAAWDPWASYQGLREDMYNLVTRIERFDDAYWLRMFAMAAMQSRLHIWLGEAPETSNDIDELIDYSVMDAARLLADIKRVEKENEK